MGVAIFSAAQPNLANGSNDSSAAGYGLGGLQYKWHNDKLSPFLRGFVGAANLSPDCCHGTEWSFAAGGGGGVDLTVTPRLSIRLGQVDYIYSSYSHVFPSTHSTEWNSVRVAAGVVFTLGSYCNLPLSCSVTATPAEVFAGEPIRLSTAGTNFNPKHPLTYGWTSNGGKVSSSTTQAAEIDTTGVAPGSYSVSSTVTDPKIKTANSATCSASFVVKRPPPPPPPPVVSCSISPSTIAVGESAVVTMTASSPDQRPLTYSWSANGGQVSGAGASATLVTYAADGGKTITVTATATDDRSLSMSSTCSVDVKAPVTPPCVHIEESREQCTFDKNPKRPWRVDNDCKDILDKIATRLQQNPNETLVIVGYTDQKETVKDPSLAARRSANVKYYLSKEGSTKIDPARIQPRQGGTQGKVTEFYFIPEGKLCAGELEKLGTAVDETQVHGRPRLPAGKKKPAKSTSAASPSQ
jgi:outer membrane protein OmpA-like peptidoglycan-associated protein